MKYRRCGIRARHLGCSTFQLGPDSFIHILLSGDINIKSRHDQRSTKSLHFIFKLADPLSALGAASASVSFGAFATKSVKTLYDLIKRFHGYPDTVRHLKTDLHGLLIVLARVQ